MCVSNTWVTVGNPHLAIRLAAHHGHRPGHALRPCHPTFHNSRHHYATVGPIAHGRPINATMPPLPRYPTPSLHQPDMPWRIHQAFPHPQSTAPRQPRDYLNPPHPCYHSSPLFLPPPCRAVVACATVYFFKIFEKNYHRFII